MSDSPHQSPGSRWSLATQRGLAVPLLAIFFFGALLYLFHAVMLPFVMALVIVYLMEPMVRRMTGVAVLGRRLPRWAAVVSVYLTFFAGLSVFLVLFIPPLTQQVGEAAEEIPGYFAEVREKYLPRWSAQLEELLGLESDREKTRVREVDAAMEVARDRVSASVERASAVQELDVLPVIERSGDRPLLHVGGDRAPPPKPRPRLGEDDEIPDPLDRSRVALTLVPDPKYGGFALLMGEADLRILPQDDGSFLVRLEPDGDEAKMGGFDLEREIVKGLSGLVESGTEYAGDLLALVQTLLYFVINAFVQIILMFMVAAFISIDLPRIMAFVRSLIPPRGLSGYDELMSRLNRGLAGVIRGQLVICAINGTLTGIGLWVLDVDFALMLGIVAGVLSLIPIFGTIISTIPAVLLALTQGISTAFLVLAWILIVHFIDANFFTPKIVGTASELHPVTIIFALLAGESAFGLFGALLAVPVASIVQTIFLFILDRVRDEERQVAPTIIDIPQQPRPPDALPPAPPTALPPVEE